jgi:hypothetical protein
VESPAKARTIAAMLGPDFVVESSVGHIRDLPRSAGEVPAAYRGEGWARLGVDVDNGFKPLYVISPEKKSVVSRLKKAVREASEVYVATDEDREGESIAWHLIEVLSPDVPVKRMVFHEITRPAIERAVENWRDLDRRLVDAQEARRILDRLYGYEVSPVLWKKVMPKLSAGRVQSVATRMIVDRERARMRFRAAGWWDVEGTFERSRPSSSAGGQHFKATLVSLDGVTLATGRDFTETGELKAQSPETNGSRRNSRVRQLDEVAAQDLAARLTDRPFEVKSVSERPFRRSPAAPFITSTLQQEASRKLRFGSQRTMQVAQRLYEQGWITYMRTDSTTLSDEALERGARAGGPPLRQPSTCRTRPAATSEGEERTGGSRGHPPLRRHLQDPRAGSRRARRRRDAPLRPHLEAHRRLADGRRHRDHRSGPHRGDRGPGRIRARPRSPSSACRARSSPSRDSCGPTSRVPTTPTPSSPSATRSLPALTEGDALSARRHGGALAHHPAPRPLHRGFAREGPRGPGGRAALDLRQHHRDHPGPGLRVEEGHGPVPSFTRSPWSGCSSGTSGTWSTTGSPPRWKTTST